MVTGGCFLGYLEETNKHNQISAISASNVPIAAVELTLSDGFLCGLLKIIRILPAKKTKTKNKKTYIHNLKVLQPCKKKHFNVTSTHKLKSLSQLPL